MLWLFAQQPMLWFYPALVTLVVMILIANLIPLRGEAKILRNPTIIICFSLLWFITVPFAVVGGGLFTLSKLVGLLIRKRE